MGVYGKIDIYKDTNIYLNEIYSTDKLNDFYNNFVETYKNKLLELKSTFQRNECVEYEKALPLLHEMGWNFFNIASEDPVLPKELLPIWKGEEATNLMKEFREILLKPINQYLQKFI